MSSETPVVLNNPYVPFKPALESNFVGRMSIWHDYFEKWFEGKINADKHIIFFGPSGVGKTSLLRKLEHRALLWDIPALYIDFRAPETDVIAAVQAIRRVLPLNSADALLAPLRGQFSLPDNATRLQIIREMLSRVGRGISWSIPGGISFNPKSMFDEVSFTDALNSLQNELAQIVNSGRRSHTLILLDQVEALTQSLQGREGGFNRHFLYRLQSMLEETTETCLMIVLGIKSESMGDLLGIIPNLMDTRVIKPWVLEPFAPADARALIELPLEHMQNGITFSDALVNAIIKVSGTEPSSLQLSCFFLWEELIERGLVIPGSEIDLPISEVGAVLSGRLEDRFWSHLTQNQHHILKLIAQYQPISGQKLAQLAEEYGVTTPFEVTQQMEDNALRPLRHSPITDQYTITHDLLTAYILKQIPDAERDLQLVKTVLAEAPRQFAAFERLLFAKELDKIWMLRRNLHFDDSQMEVIVRSDMQQEEPMIANWGQEYPKQVLPILEKLSKDFETETKIQTAKWLEEIGGEDIHALLTEWLFHEDAELRAESAHALRTCSHPDTSRLLIKALRDDESAVRCAAIDSLGETHSVEAIEPLIECMNDEDRRVIYASAYALSTIGTETVGKRLLDTLDGANEPARAAVCQALGAMQYQRAVPALQRSFSDESQTVRLAAVTALSKISMPAAVDGLCLALNDEAPQIYEIAIQTLAASEDDTARKALVGHLSSPDAFKYMLVVQALEQMQPLERTLELLLQTRNSNSRQVMMILRLRAILNPEESMPFLIDALDTEEPSVRRFACRMLKRLNITAGALDHLIDTLHRKQDWEVRQAIVLALQQSDARKATEALAHIAEHDESQQVRWIAQKVPKPKQGLTEQTEPSIVAERLAFALEYIMKADDPKQAILDLLSADDAKLVLSGLLFIRQYRDMRDDAIDEHLVEVCRNRDTKTYLNAMIRWAITEIMLAESGQVLGVIGIAPFEEYWPVSSQITWLFEGLKHDAWFVRKASLVVLWHYREVRVFETIAKTMLKSERRDPARRTMNHIDFASLPSPVMHFGKEEWARAKNTCWRTLEEHYMTTT